MRPADDLELTQLQAFDDAYCARSAPTPAIYAALSLIPGQNMSVVQAALGWSQRDGDSTVYSILALLPSRIVVVRAVSPTEDWQWSSPKDVEFEVEAASFPLSALRALRVVGLDDLTGDLGWGGSLEWRPDYGLEIEGWGVAHLPRSTESSRAGEFTRRFIAKLEEASLV